MLASSNSYDERHARTNCQKRLLRLQYFQLFVEMKRFDWAHFFRIPTPPPFTIWGSGREIGFGYIVVNSK